jgi:hypothetical protein
MTLSSAAAAVLIDQVTPEQCHVTEVLKELRQITASTSVTYESLTPSLMEQSRLIQAWCMACLTKMLVWIQQQLPRCSLLSCVQRPLCHLTCLRMRHSALGLRSQRLLKLTQIVTVYLSELVRAGRCNSCMDVSRLHRSLLPHCKDRRHVQPLGQNKQLVLVELLHVSSVLPQMRVPTHRQR